MTREHDDPLELAEETLADLDATGEAGGAMAAFTAPGCVTPYFECPDHRTRGGPYYCP